MSRHERLFRNAGAPNDLVVLNYAQSKIKIPGAEEVPTLLPSAIMDGLANGDAEPVFKIEAIDFPAKGSGGIYDKSFFQSFINVTKTRPIPGSKRGHEWTSRASSDFYTVGGRIDANGDGKTGTAFLKVYIPPTGDPTENAGFIRDARAGIVHFSLVSHPDFNVKTEKDEMGNPIQVRHFTASMGRERNDAMEYGAGAMAQVVNSLESFDFDLARSLIAEGKVDRSTKIDGSPLQNGCLYRSALRVMLSRANEIERPELAELISQIDRSPTMHNGGKSVDKEEALKLISNLIKNGAEAIQDIAKALGFGDKLKNEADTKNEQIVLALNAKLGDKPLERLEAVLAENAANAELTVKNAIQDLAGPASLDNPDKTKTEKIPNAAHAYAVQKCAGLSGDALKNGIEALKKDPIMITLNAQRADGNSGMNKVLHNGDAAQRNDSGDGIPTTMIRG